MSEFVEIRAVVRREMLDRVVHRLKECGVPRLTVTHLHAVGSGADPGAGVSLEEGTEASARALIAFICAAERAAALGGLITRTARTGRRGDGIVSVHPVAEVIKIRTGDCGLAALA